MRVRARWRVLLPIPMLLLSALLMVLARREGPMLSRMGTGWEVPARVLNFLINGPGFVLSRFLPIPMPEALNRSLSYDADRLPGVVAFWFLVGLSIDRRRNKQSIDSEHPVYAGVLFTLPALALGFFGIAGIIFLFRDPILRKTPIEFPLRTWHTISLGLQLWCVGLSAYFTRRAFVATQRRMATKL
jgi:hypothetical protein